MIRTSAFGEGMNGRVQQRRPVSQFLPRTIPGRNSGLLLPQRPAEPGVHGEAVILEGAAGAGNPADRVPDPGGEDDEAVLLRLELDEVALRLEVAEAVEPQGAAGEALRLAVEI